MPRLRLRLASTNVTYKLELPQDCTWAGLQAETRRAVGLSPDADVMLSLNKKTPLHGSPGDPWSSLGICGGDLVWLLSPAQAVASSPTSSPAPDPAMATAPVATPVAAAAFICPEHIVPIENAVAFFPPKLPRPLEARRAATAGAADQQQRRQEPACSGSPGPAPDPGGGGGAMGVDVDGAAAQALRPGGGAAGGAGAKGDVHGGRDGGDDVDVDEEAAAAAVADEPSTSAEAEAQFLPAIRGVSLKLLRLLVPPSSTSAGATHATKSSSAAATSGPGPSSSTTASSSSGAPSPSAPGGSDKGGDGGTDWLSLPPATRCLMVVDCAMTEAGFEGLQDLPAIAGQTGSTIPRQLRYGCSFLSIATAGSSGADGGASSGGGDHVMTEAVSGDEPVVKLLWYGMGRYLVVHGVPCISGGHSAAAAASRLSPATLHIDLAEYGSGSSAPSTGAGGGDGSPLMPTQLLLPPDPAGHWRRLKDGLVLPLLAAACRTAGMPPPLGLTVLPLELQTAVLRRLEARELAVLSCACTALHHLASEDELWRPLYDTEFGPVPGSGASAADAALANSRGYKYLYGRKWRERAERRKRRQVFRVGPPPHQPPEWGPPPRGLFVRPPYMPPGTIGGDYDRFPPPLMGGVPPAILGGFGSAGGMFAGGRGGGGFSPGLGPRRLGPWGSSGGGGGLGGGGFL